ncbi:Apoptosis inhibitor 5 [Lamellibrachia satsuma]|nr:Apoptosis inhibitor 5 [Lamellibrachia satsuma]
MLMRVLSSLATMSTLQGRKQLVEIVCEQADLDAPFDVADSDSIERLLQCGKEAIPLFSKNVHSTKFLKYLCSNVLPVLGEISTPAGEDEGAGEGENGEAKTTLQLDVLKLFAEMSSFCGELEKPEHHTQIVFNSLLEYMPLPPASSDENTPDMNGDQPKLQFSHVECLMYAFHQMARRCPQILTDDTQADRLKDFRLRLQYFARGVQVYIKQLKMALQGKTGADLKTDENKLKVAALKITSNINMLIKDLFHNPPSYKAIVTLSWRPTLSAKATQAPAPIPGQKRPAITPITFESDNSSKKVSKNDRQVYSPPGGKYSDRAGTFPAGTRGGWGGQRGRGRGRGWRRW